MNIEFRRLTIDCITKRLQTNCQSIQTCLHWKWKIIWFITCVQKQYLENQTSTHSLWLRNWWQLLVSLTTPPYCKDSKIFRWRKSLILPMLTKYQQHQNLHFSFQSSDNFRHDTQIWRSFSRYQANYSYFLFISSTSFLMV